MSRRTYHGMIPIENIRLPVLFCSSNCNLLWKIALKQCSPIPAQRDKQVSGRLHEVIQQWFWLPEMILASKWMNPFFIKGFSKRQQRVQLTCTPLDWGQSQSQPESVGLPTAWHHPSQQDSSQACSHAVTASTKTLIHV
jgi:hypothetical protein